MDKCSQQDVSGYPTIKLYKEGQLYEEYLYARTFERMKKFLQEKLFDVSDLMPNEIGVYDLNDVTFPRLIESSGSTPIFVKFYVESCPHCKNLKNVWDELVINFEMEEAEDVIFAQVDCIEATDICTDEGIDNYPQILLYKDGQMEDIYDGDRTFEAIKNFVWEEVDETRLDTGMDPFDMMLGMMGGEGHEEEDEEEYEEDDEEYEYEEGDEEDDDNEDEVEDDEDVEDATEHESKQEENKEEDPESGRKELSEDLDSSKEDNKDTENIPDDGTEHDEL